MLRFIGLIVAVVAGMFIYDNFIDKSVAKDVVSNVVKNNELKDAPQSITEEFEKFKAKRMEEFEEFKKGKQ